MGNCGEGIVGRFVMRVDVDDEPSGGRACGNGRSIQRIHASVLQQNQCGQLAFLDRRGDITLCLRAQRFELELAEFNARDSRLDWRQDRVDRDFRLLDELRFPKRVEVGRPGRLEFNLGGRDGGAPGIESIVATGFATGETVADGGCVRGGGRGLPGKCRHRFDGDVKLLGFGAADFDPILTLQKVEDPLFE